MTNNQTATQVAVIATKQTTMVAKFLAKMQELRPDVTFDQSERDGKVILQGHGPLEWPEIAVGKQGGIVIWVRTYDESKKSAFEWALEADQLLAKQVGRDAKKAGVGKEEVVVEKNVPPAPPKKERVRSTKDEMKEKEQKAKEQGSLADMLQKAIDETQPKMQQQQ